MNATSPLPPASASAILVETLAHTHFINCYQCGKCTAGCPMAAQMDIVPNQLIRLLQLGRVREALEAQSIWQCVSCQTCSTRCPKSVNCAGIMDGLRQVSLEEGRVSPAQRRVMLFQKAFLDNIRRNGRLDELELIAQFKLLGFMHDRRLSLLFQDATLAPKLNKRKKLHLRSKKVRDRAVLGRIFARSMDHS